MRLERTLSCPAASCENGTPRTTCFSHHAAGRAWLTEVGQQASLVVSQSEQRFSNSPPRGTYQSMSFVLQAMNS